MNRYREASVEELLLRAAAFRAIAQGFAYPARDQVAFAAGALGGVAKRAGELGNRGLERAFRHLARTWPGLDAETLRQDYQRLFLGSGPVSLHETAYGDGRRIAGRTAELADISGFYLAFGFGIAEGDPDLPDHLCAELEFVSALLVKLAYAGRNGWSPARQVVRRALRSVLEHHLGRWPGSFAAALRESQATGAYQELARTVELLVGAEARLFRVQPRLATGRLPHDAMQDDAIECPLADASAAHR